MIETYTELVEHIQKINLSVELDVIQFAYAWAHQAHKGQKRLSGEPYIIHPLNVADNLVDLRMDTATIAAGLMHDMLEDTKWSFDDMKIEFGEEIANLVEGVTKIGGIKMADFINPYGYVARYPGHND